VSLENELTSVLNIIHKCKEAGTIIHFQREETLSQQSILNVKMSELTASNQDFGAQAIFLIKK